LQPNEQRAPKETAWYRKQSDRQGELPSRDSDKANCCSQEGGQRGENGENAILMLVERLTRSIHEAMKPSRGWRHSDSSKADNRALFTLGNSHEVIPLVYTILFELLDNVPDWTRKLLCKQDQLR
jgi:hypothetical protein